MPGKRELVIELCVMVAITLALAAFGPFGTFNMGGLAERLAYWLPLGLAGYAIFRPTMAVLTGAARRLDLPEAGALLVGIVLAAAPLTLLVLWWNGNRLGALPSFADWFQLYIQVAIVGAVVTSVFWLIEGRRPAVPAAPGEPPSGPAGGGPEPRPTPPRAPFLDRLPAAWNGELVALEMEDHYVRAHGPGGSRLILMRMRDAEAELADVDGMRVHRSWWVARRAVERAVRAGRNYVLHLQGGVEAPVARDRVAALRAAGWLD